MSNHDIDGREFLLVCVAELHRMTGRSPGNYEKGWHITICAARSLGYSYRELSEWTGESRYMVSKICKSYPNYSKAITTIANRALVTYDKLRK